MFLHDFKDMLFFRGLSSQAIDPGEKVDCSDYGGENSKKKMMNSYRRNKILEVLKRR